MGVGETGEGEGNEREMGIGETGEGGDGSRGDWGGGRL